ncbi:hypothetical protein Achl_4363 (plasmid) [Pseudarthrobacter chlorophenolicus A6]|uniref:Uncharacterized protein n=1 Tax=Pseudarthrobacter chlorophenolicus (strain ATCC 700700 / DSM 12829 / CIP 107037 / JCM 12360 / KCTC 9906 / NCIMB 13794 / A6) TaxID=452863 RepID=B8HIR7_PSECP|nr:hypothetical protein [Pseudarthrobacter chlorophenolicus]ACL42314.1 hypothetical protein Achl_4363 [Pseudarthrobacter chlorophenolicus A6]SDQ16368.1 hypothetical protein SAMN04489738_0420 [Pseudarthrobacter chlorophenolicus]
MRSRKLNVSRREWQKLLVEGWGKENEPGGDPWFAEGRFVQHLTPGIFVHVGFCGRDVGSTSSNPIRTLFGITCPGCTRVAKSIAKRIAAEKVDSGQG